MKLFISGAQGVGKSTVNNAIAGHFELRSIDSISKKFFRDRKVFDDLNSEEYKYSQLKILVYAMNIYVNEDGFVSSRSLADSYAYLQHTLAKTDDDDYRKYIEMTFEYQDIIKDELHFYIPPEFNLQNGNKLRSTNVEFQKEIDGWIGHFLETTNTNYHVITGTTEARAKQIIQIVEKEW